MPRRHNTPLANNEIAVDVDASTPHVIGAGSTMVGQQMQGFVSVSHGETARLQDCETAAISLF